MKIRLGFVSNSSSSSYLIALPAEVETIEDIRKTFFGEEEEVDNSWSYSEEKDLIPTLTLAEIINRKLIEKNGIEEIYEVMQGFLYNFNVSIPHRYGTREYENAYRKIETERTAKEFATIKLFMDINKDCKFYVGSFASDGGDSNEAYLRGADCWGRVAHICSSE
jgi:hypothetical protein